MPGKLNLYNLGDLGVHLVETPVHSPDGSFTTAQNAAVSQNEGQHGIRKRLGLAKLNAAALDGAVLAIGNLPFTDPFAPIPSSGARAYAADYTEGITGDFISTTNGTTWATPGVSPSAWGETVLRDFGFTQRGGVISSNGLITYLSSAPALLTFDGATETLLATLSLGSFSIQSGPVMHDGVPYFVVHDATSGKLLRQAGSAVEEVTTAIGKPPTCVASILGRVYIGTDEDRIYYWSESEGLVLDVTLSPTGGSVTITDIAHSNGIVYATACTKTGSTTATTHKVLKRTADGAWTDITPTAQGDYGPIAHFDSGLYVVRNTHDTFTGCEVRLYDGTSWTTTFDVTSIVTGARNAISLVAWNNALYATVGGTTSRDVIRNFGGTWTRVHTEVTFTTQYYTALGFY